MWFMSFMSFTSEFDVTEFVQKDVLRLDVSMGNVVAMQMTEGQTHTREVVAGEVQGDLRRGGGKSGGLVGWVSGVG